jgi:hypothetical protein
MKKSKKLLRRFLADYLEKFVKMPYTKDRSRLVDCITVILESLNENS